MDRLGKIALISGIAILVLGVALSVFDIAEQAAPVVIAWAMCLLFLAFFRTYLSKKGEAYKDERTQKLQFTAMAISWWIIFVTLAAMYVLTASDLIRMPLEHLVLVIIFVMGISYLAGTIYITRRGV